MTSVCIRQEDVIKRIRLSISSSKKQSFSLPDVNEKITCPEVVLIKHDGESLGIMPTHKAIAIARDAGLDLVIVSSNATPPVSKMLDFGRYKYDLKKKQHGSSTGSKKLKELNFGVSIGRHDLDIKLTRAVDFIEQGHQVRFTIKMHGRELMHKDVAVQLACKVMDHMRDFAKTQDLQPTILGNTVTISFAPDKTKKKNLKRVE